MKGELIRYGIAGAIAFACDILVLYLCTDGLGWNYLLSNVASYSTGLLVSYWLNIYWVFEYRRLEARSGMEFLLFNAIVLLGFGISQGMMALMVEVAGLHYLMSKVLSAAVVTAYNFLAKKFLLFSRTVSGSGGE